MTSTRNEPHDSLREELRTRLESAERERDKWRDECVVEARLHAAKLKRAVEAEAKAGRLREALETLTEAIRAQGVHVSNYLLGAVNAAEAALRGEGGKS